MIDGNISCYRRFIKAPTIRIMMQDTCLQIFHRSYNCVSSSEQNKSENVRLNYNLGEFHLHVDVNDKSQFTIVRNKANASIMLRHCARVNIYQPSLRQPNSLGTIKASQVVVLNEDMQLLINENSYKQRDPNPQIELTSLRNIYINMCVVLNEDHAIYKSFR